MYSSIVSIKAREILDSRGNPTVEVEVKTKSGFGVAAAPSGASTGTFEAHELRDGGKRYHGKGVLNAVGNVNKKISGILAGQDSADQPNIDKLMLELDGTENKSSLGANAIVATSLAVARAAASSLGIPLYKHLAKISGHKGVTLPVPEMNVLNGGEHAGGALAVQEFMIVPAGARDFREAVGMGSEVYHILGSLLEKKYGPAARNLGDEGGFAPPCRTTREALDFLMDAIDASGHGKKVFLALDAAASSFYNSGKYKIDGNELTREKLEEHYLKLLEEYPIVMFEDPFEENDFDGWADFNSKAGKKTDVVGDDLLVTNPKRLKLAIEKKSANALLLKVNQIGTLTEAISAANLAFRNKWAVVVSHRSGETMDSTIADLAVGLDCGRIKTGSLARGERVEKYNRLLRIEEELRGQARYPGKGLFKF